jgi:2',3'-cyclic-nucleotide 2'-phosphodiesterase (5'-nucleotidase family)
MTRKKLLAYAFISLFAMHCTFRQTTKPTLHKIPIIYITDWNIEQSAQIASLIKQEKTINPVLTLINSRIFSGDTDSITQQLSINILNATDIDAVLVSADFLYAGIDNCRQIIRKSDFYCLGANLKDKTNNANIGHEYLIKQLNNFNLCVIGVIYDTLNPLYQSPDFELRSPDYSVLKLITLVKNRSDFVCLLTRSNDSLDFPVDLILGAPAQQQFPVVPSETKGIYKLEIGLDNASNIIEIKRHMLALDSYLPDPSITNIIAQYQK